MLAVLDAVVQEASPQLSIGKRLSEAGCREKCVNFEITHEQYQIIRTKLCREKRCGFRARFGRNDAYGEVE